MTTHTITAIYDSAAEAEQARARLLAEGLPDTAVRIVTHSLERNDVASDEHEKTFWESMTDFFIGIEDRPMYSESLRRGGYLLTTRVDDTESDAVIATLESTNAVDLDERVAQWRDEGWTSEELPPPSMSGYAPGAGPTTETIREQLQAETGEVSDAAMPDEAPVRRRVRTYGHLT